ncbi:MAG: DUF2846 domain-containing protein [Verrucomicrobiales bacterium]|jgi:hypothetical protein|nr:DUF2846 domain-containing protein [Verrucomicrobiales bacterium]
MKTKLLTALTMTAALAITFILSGCATAPMASQAAHAEALAFTPPFGMANIYIMRDGLRAPQFLALTTIDGQRTGDLPSDETYVMKSVPPGVHTVGCMNPNNGLLWTPITFTAQAGQNYFFVTNCSAWAHRFPIKQISFEEARKTLKNCERVQGL